MTENDLNIKYIQEKTGLVENDELIPIILSMIKEAYKSGLVQAEIDNTMGVIEENSNLKQRIDKAIEYLKETTFDYGTDEMIFDKCDAYTLLSILQGKEVKDNG